MVKHFHRFINIYLILATLCHNILVFHIFAFLNGRMFFFFSNEMDKNIILQEIKASGGTAERTENTRSYEDG